MLESVVAAEGYKAELNAAVAKLQTEQRVIAEESRKAQEAGDATRKEAQDASLDLQAVQERVEAAQGKLGDLEREVEAKVKSLSADVEAAVESYRADAKAEIERIDAAVKKAEAKLVKAEEALAGLRAKIGA